MALLCHVGLGTTPRLLGVASLAIVLGDRLGVGGRFLAPEQPPEDATSVLASAVNDMIAHDKEGNE